MGKNEDIKKNSLLFLLEYSALIEEKNVIKDLGIMIDDDLGYMAVCKAQAKSGWILRTFRIRSVDLMRQLWNSLAQPHLDYGSVLWYPSDQKSLLMKGEAPLRAF